MSMVQREEGRQKTRKHFFSAGVKSTINRAGKRGWVGLSPVRSEVGEQWVRKGLLEEMTPG